MDTNTEEKKTGPVADNLQRAREYVKKHPILALLAAVGVGAVAGTEVAVGALVGIGAGLLFAQKSGEDLREQLWKKGTTLVDRGAELSAGVWAWTRARTPWTRGKTPPPPPAAS